MAAYKVCAFTDTRCNYPMQLESDKEGFFSGILVSVCAIAEKTTDQKLM